MKNSDLSSCDNSYVHTRPNVHTRVSLRKPLRCGFAVVLCSCLFYGAAQCRAQESQQQGVAEAARRDRARRDHENRPPHVYTDEDLRRLKILTPEDEARLAATRKLQPPALESSPQEPLDASAELPLGDIARLYRSAKRATEPAFHFSEETEFASPVLPIEPSSIPRSAIEIAPSSPRVAPAHPKVIVAPHVSSGAPVRRVDPFSRRLALVAPEPPVATPKLVAPATAPSVRTTNPVAPMAVPSAKAASPDMRSVKPMDPVAKTTVKPSAPANAIVNPVAPRTSGTPAVDSRNVTVQAGDSLWKIAEQTLGRGSRWRDLLAANPSIANPNVLEVGTRIVVPADVRAPRASKAKVNAGDTLTKIAVAQYGRAAYWRCIADANPAVNDANRIYEGEELQLPARCKP